MARRFAPRAETAGPHLEVAATASGTMCRARLRLEQALGNLVDNALRHGEKPIGIEAAGEKRLVRALRPRQGGRFPADFVPHAFERLSRAEESRPRGGAGLGLAIVGAVARAHGGSIQATSGEHGGAVVTIVIPAAPADPEAAEQSSTSLEPASS